MSRAALALTALVLSAAPALPAAAATYTVPPAGGVAAPAASTSAAPPTQTGQATTLPASGAPTGAPAPAPAAARKGSGGLSGGAILAALLGGLVLLGALVWAAFRLTAFEPHWLLSLRHSLAEAGFRSSATWAEFTDWVRLGR